MKSNITDTKLKVFVLDVSDSDPLFTEIKKTMWNDQLDLVEMILTGILDGDDEDCFLYAYPVEGGCKLIALAKDEATLNAHIDRNRNRR